MNPSTLEIGQPIITFLPTWFIVALGVITLILGGISLVIDRQYRSGAKYARRVIEMVEVESELWSESDYRRLYEATLLRLVSETWIGGARAEGILDVVTNELITSGYSENTHSTIYGDIFQKAKVA